MSPKPPPLDQSRWQRLWSRLGGRGNGQDTFDRLTTAYAEPARAYHTIAHILDCLIQFDSSRELARRPHEVEAALWFHDAVYVPGAADNEDRSAAMMRTALGSGDVSEETISRIAELVLATRHSNTAVEPDAQLVADIDLSILGREPPAFDLFERQIRQEYAWVAEPLYRSSRTAVLTSFLRRPSIYQTQHYRERYEAPARHNLERVLAHLAR